MAGNATGRAVSSIKAMLEPRIVAARTQGAAFGAQGDFAFLERITPSSHGCFTTPAIGLIPFPHVAEATLFTDRCLTSPAANTPGMLVSRSKGWRSRGHLWGGRSPPGVPSRMRFQISFLVSLRRS